MKPAESELSIEFLRDVLDYNPQTGIFVCKKKYASKISVGAIVGGKHMSGYKQIMLQGKQFLSHRLAWFYAHGHWPTGEIDHINGVRDDNRLTNLRDVDRKTNAENRRKPQSDNQTGFLGVRKKRGKFVSEIKVNGKTTRIGTFETAELAHAAFVEAKRIHHAGCTI